MKGLKNRIPPVIWILIFSILGFFIASLAIVMQQENRLIKEGILNQEFIYDTEMLIIDKRALFFLCFGRRIRAFFLLFLLAFSSVNIFVNSIFFLGCGIYTGSIMELLAVRYGMQGIGMYFTMIFPQGIFYALGFGILGCWCLNQERVQSNIKNRKVEKLRNIKNKKAVILAFVLVLIGIFLESYVNPKIFFFFI